MGRPRHLTSISIAPIAEESTTTTSSSSSSSSAMACAISSEASSVLAVMRSSLRWSRSASGGPTSPSVVVPAGPASDDGLLDHPLVLSFKSLRRHLFAAGGSHPWASPVAILAPFLEVIRSDEAGAAVTSAALTSLHQILSLGVVDSSPPAAAGAALREVVDAVTGCRFEAVDAAAEEAVLMRILQVLLACMKGAAAALLGDQHVCTAVNTCFRVVHQAGAKGELLQRFSRHAMHELVRCVFGRLPLVIGEGEEEEEAGASGVAKGEVRVLFLRVW